MLKVGIVGFRGMVGSVLVERMVREGDFDHCEPFFFSTSQAGAKAPNVGREVAPVADASSVKDLAKLDAIISCQGGDYTTEIHPALRAAGFRGAWIDAASTLRMKDDAVIILDPVNRPLIDASLKQGVRDFIGGNCTVSLMLMAVHGLYAKGWVEWISTMTYQAASGAGAKNMRELILQMRALSEAAAPILDDPSRSILDLDRAVSAALASDALPKAEFGFPLAASLLPYIDKPVEGGQSREEWKGHVESNKILGLSGDQLVPVDGICVRVGAMRCHSQGLTIKLKRDIPLADIEATLAESNAWVRLVKNDKPTSLAELTPASVSGTLSVPIGRVRKLKLGPTFLGAFTVGDQLLWGAAEPLRRMLRIMIER
ncbi:MAG: aspartate-semialdehyde dehydrogenase [Polyangiaceae bacterium]|nr:aspartate-semialdehyde dehydrogenase [Polyangiaceae bacterium]